LFNNKPKPRAPKLEPKELLSWLSRVELLLNEFSFEELDASQASMLKNSFEHFTKQLHDIVSGNSISDSWLSKSSQSSGNQKSSTTSTQANLITSVSHELRTPLNGIIGFADLLKETELTNHQLTHLNAIHTASNSLMEIINELLEYSKLTGGHEQFQFIHFNFYRLVRDVVFLIKTLIVNKNVTLEMTIDPSIPEVLIGEPTKLSQILLNLLGNAVKFVEDGHIDLQIVLATQKQKEVFLEFNIVDNGIGISKEELPLIFDSYSQADFETSKKYGGTGLGLSIVKELISQLGGVISVVSNLGKGTSFKFQLPFEEGDKTKLRKNNTRKDYLKTGIAHIKGTRILVFEDNSLNQRLIEQRLKQWHCAVFITDNPNYGINILETQDIDLVLMDLKMPKMSGFEVSSLIRKHEKHSINQVPIIAVTADFTIRDKEDTELHGINDFLLKPYSPDELLLKLLSNKQNSTPTRTNEDQIELKNTISSDAISLNQIVDDCMGDVEAVNELVQLFKLNILEFIGEVKCHLGAQDFEAMQFSFHKIKSSLALMQTETLHELVVEMDACAKAEKDIKHLNFLYECFVKEYPMLEQQLDDELKKLKGNR